MRRFRTRLAATVIGLVVLTAVLLGAGSYLFVSRSLRGQFAADAAAQAEFDIAELATEERLPTGSGLAAFEASGLAEAIGGAAAPSCTWSSAKGSRPTPRASPWPARPPWWTRICGRSSPPGAWAGSGSRWAATPTWWWGGRRPAAGPDFYIYFPAGDVAAALTRLWQALAGGGVVLTALAAVAAGAIARRVLHPVAAGSRAAGAIAAGDLSARLPVSSGDEFGAWAESFNRMAASLESSVGDLEESRDRERRFVADVSHELRTPLTALVGEASLLQEHLDSMPPEAARLGELLAADVARLPPRWRTF